LRWYTRFGAKMGMTAFEEVPAAAAYARDTLQKTGANHGWPAEKLAAMIADVDTLEESSQKWYWLDSEEIQFFWDEMLYVYQTEWAVKYADLINMNKIGTWVAGAGDATVSAYESAVAQSSFTVFTDTVSMTASDVAVLSTDVVTAVTAPKTLIYVGAFALLAVAVYSYAGKK